MDIATARGHASARRPHLALAALGAALFLSTGACGALDTTSGTNGQRQSIDGVRDDEASNNYAAASPPATPSSTAPPATPSGPCSSNCSPKTLTIVPNAVRLACSPSSLYAGTRDGRIVAVPLDGGPPADLAPPPSGVVGFLAWSDGQLFYTLPAEGEVHARDPMSSADLRLASNQPAPQGIAVSGGRVAFGTTDGVVSVATKTSDQIPSPQIAYGDLDFPQTRGASMGLAFAGPRLIVAHSPAPGDVLSGALGTYASTGEQISFYTFFSKTLGVASSATRTYWSESDGSVRFGPRPILSTGLAPTTVVAGQILIGDICLQGGRVYFTAANDDDVREIRYVDVE